MNQAPMTERRFLLYIIMAALLVPHTFEISMQTMPDNSFIRYSVITILFTLFYESGTNIAGPYSTGFILPPTSAILLNALTLVINIIIILSQLGYVEGMISRRNVLLTIGIVLCIDVFLLIGFFSYQLDSWASVLAFPLPIFPILSILVILRSRLPHP